MLNNYDTAAGLSMCVLLHRLNRSAHTSNRTLAGTTQSVRAERPARPFSAVDGANLNDRKPFPIQ